MRQLDEEVMSNEERNMHEARKFTRQTQQVFMLGIIVMILVFINLLSGS